MRVIESSSELTHLLRTQNQVMLKFSATWCGPCKAVAPVIEKIEPQFPHVTMADVDIDKNQDVAASYGITAVPSFVFLDRGTQVEQVKGPNVPAIVAALRSLASKAMSVSSGRFGKGHRLSEGNTSAEVPKSVLREVRSRRIAEKPPVKVSNLQAFNPPNTTPSLIGNLLKWAQLYFMTLFSLDARAAALSFTQ